MQMQLYASASGNRYRFVPCQPSSRHILAAFSRGNFRNEEEHEEERWKGESCEASVSSGVDPPLNFFEKFRRVVIDPFRSDNDDEEIKKMRERELLTILLKNVYINGNWLERLLSKIVLN